MKKAILIVLCLIFLKLECLADETAEVQEFFNNYVNAGNNYEKNFFDFFSKNAKIIRIVEKPDGTTKRVDIPLSRYKSEAKKSSAIAKIRRYKNKYLNIRISKQGENYKISADRMPSTADYKIPAEFIIGKDEKGEWKIKEEALNTRVQLFLSEN